MTFLLTPGIKGLKATRTFSHKIKVKFFTAKKSKNKPIFLVGVATTKIWLSICRSANWVLCKVHYFRRLMINFQLYFILINLKIVINAECLQYLPELKQHPDKIKNKKQNMVIKSYTELLGTCIKSKKTRYINTVCTKSASKA